MVIDMYHKEKKVEGWKYNPPNLDSIDGLVVGTVLP